jgi:hypothetical protein
MNRVAVEKVTETVKTLMSQAPKRLEPYGWVKTKDYPLCRATTEAVYDPQNPFRNVKIQEAY